MAWVIRDVKSASGGAGNLALPAFAVNAVAGDLIVVGYAPFSLTSVSLPSDTRANGYVQLGATSGGTSTKIAGFLAKNVSAGATTVTANGTWTHVAAVAWLIGGGSIDPYNLDVLVNFATSVSASAGPSTIGSIYPGSLFLAMVSVAGTVDLGDPSGYNTEGVNGFTAGMHTSSKKLDWAAHEDILSAYKLASSAENPTFPNSTGNLQWASIIASFALPRVPNAVSAAPSPISNLGGDTVTITGTAFGSWVTGVTLGGVAATNVLVTSSTTITCTAPAHAAGAVDIVVQAVEGNSTIVAGITYAVKPVPSYILPQYVILPAGGSATIKGSGFLAGATVDFGGVAATGVVVVDANTITCNIPAHAAGQVVITVTNP